MKTMRLDKFLKVSRLIKRRSLAKDVSDSSRVKINGKIAKPSSNVNIGDIIEIAYGNKLLTVKVKELNDSTKKADSAFMYELIKEEKINLDLNDL